MNKLLKNLLEKAGVTINGNNPYDIQIHDQRFYKRFLMNPSLGAGESYMEGWWDCTRLDELFYRITRAVNTDTIFKPWYLAWARFMNILINQQTRHRSKHVADKHYNLDNELYRIMLGPTMAYTCAYWPHANNLDQAQENKFKLICKKLDLKPGDKVLELGCGWGSFAKYAAENYGCHIVAVNISTEQIKYARENSNSLPIEFFLCDYRDQAIYNSNQIKFDKVVSIGLCEHIGYKNYRRFMNIVRNNIKEDGLFLLHTIGRNNSVNFVDPWINKYIFPNGMLPSIKQIAGSSENLFVIEDLHNFGADYDKTLMAWRKNFMDHWPQLSLRYDEKFYRMWNYYLLSCAGAFRAREMQLWQFVLTPKGKLNGYQSIRE